MLALAEIWWVHQMCVGCGQVPGAVSVSTASIYHLAHVSRRMPALCMRQAEAQLEAGVPPPTAGSAAEAPEGGGGGGGGEGAEGDADAAGAPPASADGGEGAAPLAEAAADAPPPE